MSGLDEAWAEAEALTDRKMLSVERIVLRYGAEGWLRYPANRVRELGDTPAEALRNLAAELRRRRAAAPAEVREEGPTDG